jgi:zinc resistance-associated protein
MLKTLTAGAIALTIAGAGIALAQQTPSRDGRGFHPSAEDMAAFADARIAGLKAGLKLTAEQEKHWPAVEAAIREMAKQRGERMKEFAERRAERHEARRAGGEAGPRGDMIERLRRGAGMMETRAASLKTLADAAEPLYKSLDDDQKRRFSLLMRMGNRWGGQGGHRHWHRRAELAR